MHLCTAPLPWGEIQIGRFGGLVLLEHYPTSPNDLHLFSLYWHVLQCACVTGVGSSVSMSLWVCDWETVGWDLFFSAKGNMCCVCVKMEGLMWHSAASTPGPKPSAVSVDRSKTTHIAPLCVCTLWPEILFVCLTILSSIKQTKGLHYQKNKQTTKLL